jgi:hypothetical protein
MSVKERRKREREMESEEENDSEDNDSGTWDLTEEPHVEDPWKDVNRYTFNIRDLGQLMKINLKLSAEKFSKKGPKSNKFDHLVWGALPWDDQEKNA